MNKKLISLICAILCSFIWGTAFIAQDMGMDYIGPFSFIAGRMFLGFFLTGGFALQQYSLLYTDVANSAIFTIFYVLIVPAISYFLFLSLKRLKKRNFLIIQF